MTDDDWWTQAVAEFGIDAPAAVSREPAAVVVPTPVPDAPTVGDGSEALARRRRHHPALDWILIAVAAIGVALLLRTFVVQQFAVDGQSMMGTLHSGDRVIVNKLSYDFHDPRHGDIVVLEDPTGSFQERDLIKRVVGLPGETLEYKGCQLFIDGHRVSEPYLDPALVTTDRCGISQVAVEVAAGHVFVMGDNRDASLDSRIGSIGQIPYDHLIGRAVVTVWPQSEWRWL